LYGPWEPVASMTREKSEREALGKKRVPMRGTGAEQLVVVMKYLKGHGAAKGLRHSDKAIGQTIQGGAIEFDKVI